MRLFGMAQDQAKAVIDELSTLGIGDAVTESNGNITLTNRRLFRAFKEQESNKHRQAKYRERHANEQRNGKVTNDDKNALLLLEKEIYKERKKERKKGVSGTRIPNPFPLTDEMIEWADANCPGLRLVTAHADFIEYWTNLTTAKAMKIDWNLTWQKGMRLALKWQQENLKPEPGRPSEDPEPIYQCSTCFDTGEVHQKPANAQYEWELEAKPCPNCKLAEAA
jgi:hypothetical protein